MTSNVAAIGPDMPIRDVTTLMELRRFRHFPIVEDGSGGGRVVGMVSDRDLRAVGSPHPSARPDVSVFDPVRLIMSTPVITAHPDDAIEDAARRLRRHRVGALPVIEDDRLVGIVSAVDLIEALAGQRAGHQPSSLLEVEVPNRPGGLLGVLGALARLDLNVASVNTTRSDADAVAFAIRLDTIDAAGVARALRDDGFTVLWPVTVDTAGVPT